jgi:hypothetical protein
MKPNGVSRTEWRYAALFNLFHITAGVGNQPVKYAVFGGNPFAFGAQVAALSAIRA